MIDFSIRFEMPDAGTMDIYLYKGKEQFWMGASYIYRSAPFELVRCLSSVLNGRDDGMLWFLEPEEYHFEFKTQKDLTRFQVNEHTGFDRVTTHFDVEQPTFELILAFWRGLRCLQAQRLEDEYERGWHAPFPENELNRLTEQVREAKRKQK